jgi:hypothetical protein
MPDGLPGSRGFVSDLGNQVLIGISERRVVVGCGRGRSAIRGVGVSGLGARLLALVARVLAYLWRFHGIHLLDIRSIAVAYPAGGGPPQRR